jgi:hypothetical protein
MKNLMVTMVTTRADDFCTQPRAAGCRAIARERGKVLETQRNRGRRGFEIRIAWKNSSASSIPLRFKGFISRDPEVTFLD